MGEKAELIEADVVIMDLNATFDVAMSNGGLWVSYDCGYAIMFDKAGFDFLEISSSSNGDRFIIYQKR